MKAGAPEDRTDPNTSALQHSIEPRASRGRTTQLLKGAVRSWFSLTADEQKAVLLVLGLFLLGLAARTWQLGRTSHALRPVAETAAPASAQK